MTIPFLLGLMVVALVLLSLETVSVDLVALGILVALLASGILTPQEALAGFGNEAVIVLAGLFVLSAGLRSSGAIDRLARSVARVAETAPAKALPLLLLAVVLVSAFMNNTTCTALFLPVALAMSRAAGQAPSRSLMPVAFASILGGSITVMGTSTNVIVRGLLPQYGQAPLEMFELLPVALPVAVLGLLYLLVFGRRLLPERPHGDLESRYPLRDYLAEVEVGARSPLAGRTVAEADLGHDWDLNLLAIVRAGEPAVPRSHERIAAGDVLVVEGPAEALARLGKSRSLRVRHDAEEGLEALQGPNMRLVEVLILPRSDLVGRTLEECGFRQRFAAGVIALNRHAGVLVEKLARIRLRVGDVLLVQGGPGTTERLRAQRGMLVLGWRQAATGSPRHAALATAIFAVVVALAVWGPWGLAGAVLAGCLALLATRCLTPAEAYATVEWRLLVLIAGMMAYGAAMQKSGAAALLAGWTVDLFSDLGPRGVLAGFYLLTLLLTQPMSNQAAALVVFPVAMEAASEVGVGLRAMAVTIALASSSSFLTPLEPSCLLVYGPGGYRFGDYARLGAGLSLLAFVATLLLVPWFWPQ